MPLLALSLVALLVGCGAPGPLRSPSRALTGTWEGLIRPVRGQFPIGEAWEFRDDGTYFRMRGLSFDVPASGSDPVKTYSRRDDECTWTAGRTSPEGMKSVRSWMGIPVSSGRFTRVGDLVQFDQAPSPRITISGAKLHVEDVADHRSYELERVHWYRLPGPEEIRECQRASEAQKAP